MQQNSFMRPYKNSVHTTNFILNTEYSRKSYKTYFQGNLSVFTKVRARIDKRQIMSNGQSEFLNTL